MIFASTRKYVSYFEMPAAGAFAASIVRSLVSPIQNASKYPPSLNEHQRYVFVVDSIHLFISVHRATDFPS